MSLNINVNLYKIFLAASFIFGLAIGFFLAVAIIPDCKTRAQLCAQDIKSNDSLRTQLSKSELKCSELLTATVEKVLHEQSLIQDQKVKRLEEACNDLDCLQCKR